MNIRQRIIALENRFHLVANEGQTPHLFHDKDGNWWITGVQGGDHLLQVPNSERRAENALTIVENAINE